MCVSYLDLLIGLVSGGHLMLLVERRLVAEKAHQALVGEAEEFDLLVVLAGVRAALSVEDGVERKGRVALHDVGQLEAGRQQRVGKGAPALGADTRGVRLLPAPVLGDALAAEVMLAPEADRILVDAEADGTQELVLQTASHLRKKKGERRTTLWHALILSCVGHCHGRGTIWNPLSFFFFFLNICSKTRKKSLTAAPFLWLNITSSENAVSCQMSLCHFSAACDYVQLKFYTVIQPVTWH